MLDIENSNENLLFKFIPVNINLIRLLVNSSLWYSSFDKLNDPFEGKYRTVLRDIPTDDILLQYYRERPIFRFDERKAWARIRLIRKDRSVFFRDLESDLDHSYFKRQYVASFCLTFSEILLWSHYADEHRGVCLIFKKNALLKDSQENTSLSPPKGEKIRYDKKRNIETSINIDSKGKLHIPLKFSEDVVFKKLPCWLYEKEYRIMVKTIFHEPSNGIEISFNRKALRGIIFGERCKSEDIRLIHLLLKKFNFIDNEFFWGFSRIVPIDGELQTTRDEGPKELFDLGYVRSEWLGEQFRRDPK